MTFTIEELLDLLRSEGELDGEPVLTSPPDVMLQGFAPPGTDRPHTVVWYREIPATWPDSPTVVVLCPRPNQPPGSCSVVPVLSPRRAFTKALRAFASAPRPVGRHETAVVAASSRVAADAFIGPGAFIADGVAIGERTVVHANAVVHEGVVIGSDCEIRAGAVIGAPGFGFERDHDGTWIRMEHLAAVVIGNDVEIGSAACVDRGVLAPTVVQDGAKIAGLCQIGHNVTVEARAFVASGAILAGGAIVGVDSWIGPGAVVESYVHVGARAVVGIGATVMRDVPVDRVVAATPARLIPEGVQRRL